MRWSSTSRIALLLPIVASALGLQARPVAAQSITGPETPPMAAEVRPRLSPWRDAWYLEDQTSSVSDQSIAVSDPPAATPSQAWDTWYLEEEFTSARKAAASGGTASGTALGD